MSKKNKNHTLPQPQVEEPQEAVGNEGEQPVQEEEKAKMPTWKKVLIGVGAGAGAIALGVLGKTLFDKKGSAPESEETVNWPTITNDYGTPISEVGEIQMEKASVEESN